MLWIGPPWRKAQIPAVQDKLRYANVPEQYPLDFPCFQQIDDSDTLFVNIWKVVCGILVIGQVNHFDILKLSFVLWCVFVSCWSNLFSDCKGNLKAVPVLRGLQGAVSEWKGSGGCRSVPRDHPLSHLAPWTALTWVSLLQLYSEEVRLD